MIEIIRALEGKKTSERRDVISAILKERGYDYQAQFYKHKHKHSHDMGENIIVDVGNLDKGARTVVICANYDVMEGSWGANDNASAIAVMIGLIDDLWEEGASNKIRFVFFDGTRDGLKGSKYFIEQLEEQDESVRVAINLRMVGRGDVFALWPFYAGEEFETLFFLEEKIRKHEKQMQRFPNLINPADHESFRKARIEAFSITMMTQEDLNFGLQYIENWKTDRKLQAEVYMSESPLFKYRDNIYDTLENFSPGTMDLVKDVLSDTIIELDNRDREL